MVRQACLQRADRQAWVRVGRRAWQVGRNVGGVDMSACQAVLDGCAACGVLWVNMQKIDMIERTSPLQLRHQWGDF
jgi:hypothetical protein